MNLHEKLLEMQKAVDAVIKDGKNQSDKYDFASDENVLNTFRPIMDEHKLLLVPRVLSAALHEGTTKSGTSRYMTELTFEMVWYDVESGESLTVPWYAQGVDLAGEKGVGKAMTYAEKYFLLKFFHVPTKKDDPDGGGGRGGTQAGRETADYFRRAIPQMLTELFGGDKDKIRSAYTVFTKSERRGYAGVDNLAAISPAALPVVYAKVKKTYEGRVGHPFALKEDGPDAAD